MTQTKARDVIIMLKVHTHFALPKRQLCLADCGSCMLVGCDGIPGAKV